MNNPKDSSKTENAKVLIVEDSLTQAEVLRSVLESNGYSVLVAHEGSQALSLLSKQKPDIIISDVMMPGMDGFELCRQVRKAEGLRNIPIILLTQLSDAKDILQGLQCGACNFITKPFAEDILLSRIRGILEDRSHCGALENQRGVSYCHNGRKYFITVGRKQIIDSLITAYDIAARKNREMVRARDELRELNSRLEEKVKERTSALTAEIAERKKIEKELKDSVKRLQATLQGTVLAIATIVEKRDAYTAGHQARVAKLAYAIALEMGLKKDQAEGVYMAAILHDVGKVSVPVEILSKQSRLSEMEFGIIKMHSQEGYEILRNIDFPWPIAEIVLQHHERMDGSGYPQGLAGESILLEARIIAVADVVEAMASHRPYRPAVGLKRALREIQNNKGILYDPKVSDTCLKLFYEKG